MEKTTFFVDLDISIIFKDLHGFAKINEGISPNIYKQVGHNLGLTIG